MTDGKRPLAVTMGDPAGIGLDITLLAHDRQARQGAALPAFVMIGSADALRARAATLGLAPDIHVLPDWTAVDDVLRSRLAVIDTGALAPLQAGRTDPAMAHAIIDSIERAVDAVETGHASAVVTNPIAKATLTQAGFKHPGHTEFLAELAARRRPGTKFLPVMMLASDLLRVVPLTIHIPLADVPKRISRDLIEQTVRITVQDLARYFGLRRPRLAVAGLNPHAGENGTLGREEQDIIAPAIAALREDGFDVSGPHSGDTMFHAEARARYDAAIAMYHDQALIPIKTLAFDSGVNVTLGLPFVRTSPDHGTAFDIAGTGKANPASFVAALRLAEAMADSAARFPHLSGSST